ncbi:hypothetical protein [Phosphitispora sp. TUW77]|uniref:hypothetical protein n=1 Tax=Phosphitispora sp. TUW77 TaxID=3152361 RepID=UPI003AB7D637
MVFLVSKRKLFLFLQYVGLLELKAKDFKVLLYLLPYLSFENYRKVSQKDLKHEMKMSKSDVSKAISRLIENNVLKSNPASKYKTKNKELKLYDYDLEELENMVDELVEEDWIDED